MLKPLLLTDTPPTNQQAWFVGWPADLQLTDAENNLIDEVSFVKPVNICYTYTSDDLREGGGDPADFAIQALDPATSSWIVLPSKVDTASSQVCAQVTGPTRFVLSSLDPLPVEDTGAMASSTALWWIGGLMGLALAGGLALLLRSRQTAR